MSTHLIVTDGATDCAFLVLGSTTNAPVHPDRIELYGPDCEDRATYSVEEGSNVETALGMAVRAVLANERGAS